MYIMNIFLIAFSLALIIFELKKSNFSFKLHKVTTSFLISVPIFSGYAYIKTNDIRTLKVMFLIISELLFVNIIATYIINLSKKIGIRFISLIFFYCASPIAIISMGFYTFPDKLLTSNCFISFTALILILKYSVSIVMSKEIKKVSLFHQLFLLLILITGSIFSFANLNYSINTVLGNISANIKITDYIFLYSSIFTLNYDSLVSQIGIDKLLASISMIYSYFFISTIVTTIITRLNNNI